MTMWKKFIAALDTVITTDQQKTEALIAAKKTFLSLGDWTTS
jgi:heme oxygenase